jgi:asparagine synthase (glutamine-hydrolysing)
MCGIAGYVSAAPARRDVLHRMLTAVGHRGPEGLSGMIEGPVAIGTARLAIVDLAGGIQPAIASDRQLAVVFNGEIFNYMELRTCLESRGVVFRTRSEVETLLNLYLAHGPAFVERLNGQFGIAVWDGRRRQLHLCRDRFGIRPVFWARADDGAVVFGSEVKALFAHGGVAARLDRSALAQTFRFWTTVGDTTAFEGVRQLPPGHVITFEPDGTERLTRYWSWPLGGELIPLQLRSDEAYFERFRDELDAAVARQRMADVPIGSYLSGGVDSSVMAGRLLRQQPGLRTYSVAFEDPEYDESAAQRAVSKHLGQEHVTETIAGADIARVFPQVVWHAETPLFRTAPAPLFLLSRRVHDDGIKVVMTGEGADEVLLGYDLFREAAVREFWKRRPESTWRASLFRRLYAYLPQYRNPRYFHMVVDFYRPTLSAAPRHFAMAVRWANGRALEQYFSDDMKAFARAYNPIDEFERWLPAAYDGADSIGQAQYAEVCGLLGNYLLSSQGDRMSLAHGVEGRYPYLDEGFVNFAARLPRRLKLRGMKDKFILRHAFADTLPPEIRGRAKVAYQAPDMKAFLADGKAPDYVEELLAPERIAESGLFDPARVQQLIAKGRSLPPGRLGIRDNMAFTLMLSTMLLHETFVKKTWRVGSDIPTQKGLTLI